MNPGSTHRLIRTGRPSPTNPEVQEMAQSLKSVNAITLFVEDQQRSKEFYERVFEVAAADEEEGTVIFKFANLFLRLLTRGAAENETRAGTPSRLRFGGELSVGDLCGRRGRSLRRTRRAWSLDHLRSDRPSLGRAQRGVPRPRRPCLGVQRRHPRGPSRHCQAQAPCPHAGAAGRSSARSRVAASILFG